MAKRKRLTPAKAEYLEAPTGLEHKAFGALSGPPIAQVSGNAAAVAALDEVSAVLQQARDEGRMIQALPLSAIEDAHLVRDRLASGLVGDLTQGDEDWQALKDSLRARGQQVPIEVLDLGAGRYGLISGWRRLTVLRQLAQEADPGTGDGPSEVLALIRQPETSAAAYVAMVEENEIRVGLSFFERARIVVQAVDQGVYRNEKTALQGLFSTARPAKRSKIKSFIPVVRQLGDILCFPTHIPERTGLALSKALTQDAGFAERLAGVLQAGKPAAAQDEALLLAEALKGSLRAATEPVSESVCQPVKPAETQLVLDLIPGVRLSARRGRVVLDGGEVTPGFIERLQDWVRSQG